MNFQNFFGACAVFLVGSLALAQAAPLSNAILVDKKTNNLHLCEYGTEGQYKITKTYHATLGQVKGDKEDEFDLKTPEGIYTFKALRKPPKLAKKFGAMGFDIDFPNAYDKLAGRTGSGIMLHATDEPDRLKKNYDSLGCIVVNNDEIAEIQLHIRLGLTPILVFSELTDEYMKPGQDIHLKAFFENWVKSWKDKDLTNYMQGYHSDFSAQGKNKEAWRAYKQGLNRHYDKIEVKAEDIHYYRHPKYSMVTFTQNYHSTLKSGRVGHHARGTKILYIAEEEGQPKIIAETYTNYMW